jgi:hypothetical protein
LLGLNKYDVRFELTEADGSLAGTGDASRAVKAYDVKNIAITLLVLLTAAAAAPIMWVKLPRLEATALDGSRLVLPDSTAANITLVGFGYQRQSQDDINSWLEPFRREYMPAEGFRACEVPMMGPNVPGLLRGIINGAMRRATPTERWRWVAPFYGDIDDYSMRLGATDRSRVHVFLLDGSGVVRWQSSGRADSTGLASLRLEVAKLAAGGGE